jgi:hypothetical protein
MHVNLLVSSVARLNRLMSEVFPSPGQLSSMQTFGSSDSNRGRWFASWNWLIYFTNAPNVEL